MCRDLFADKSQSTQEFNFTVDVCANNTNFKCKNYYSPAINGLIQQWQGSCWCNPPYGREITNWVKKAYESKCTVCLLPVRSDTKWWHQYVMHSSEIRFLTKRLSFEGSTNKAPFPNCIVIFHQLTSPKVVSYEF